MKTETRNTLLAVAAVLLPGGLIVAGLWWFLSSRPSPDAAKKGGAQ